MTDKTAFLYIDGLTSETVRVLQYQLGIIGRIEHAESKLTYVWQTTFDPEQSQAYCLGEHHQCGNVKNIHKPVLLNKAQKIEGLVFGISLPVTTMGLIDALAWVELQLSNVMSKQQTAPANHSVEVAEQAAVTETVVENNQDKLTASDKISFATYLANTPLQEQNHLLTWENGEQVCINALSNTIISSSATLSDLMKLLLSDENVQYHSGSLNGTQFSYDAVMWSFGLHTQINGEFITQHDVDTCAIRLKKWPLFGRWETESKLLMLTTLFTQKFTSVNEATVRSGLDKEYVLHFLYAAQKARLPMEYQNTVSNKPVQAKKNLGWINELRNKLHINESMVS